MRRKKKTLQADSFSEAAATQATGNSRTTTSQTNPSLRADVSQTNAISAAATSKSRSNDSLETTSKPPRGPTYCKEIWYREDGKKYQLEFNNEGQPVGDVATTLINSCGHVARMCNLCPIYYRDWRDVKEDFEEEIITFMKERFVIPQEREKIVLQTIGELWKNYKGKERLKIYEYEAKGMSKSEIVGKCPKKIEIQQWRQFVSFWLSKDGKDISKSAKESRSQQKAMHTSGSKSFARKKKELEDERGGPVGAIELYRETHKGKKERMDIDVLDVLEKCHNLMEDKITSLHDKNGQTESNSSAPLSEALRLRLEEEVMREVRGPEHPGRVRGVGRGPTMSSINAGKRKANSDMVEYLESEVAYLKKRDLEREKQFSKIELMFEELMRSRSG